jgi:hypothetical protein
MASLADLLIAEQMRPEQYESLSQPLPQPPKRRDLSEQFAALATDNRLPPIARQGVGAIARAAGGVWDRLSGETRKRDVQRLAELQQIGMQQEQEAKRREQLEADERRQGYALEQIEAKKTPPGKNPWQIRKGYQGDKVVEYYMDDDGEPVVVMEADRPKPQPRPPAKGTGRTNSILSANAALAFIQTRSKRDIPFDATDELGKPTYSKERLAQISQLEADAFRLWDNDPEKDAARAWNETMKSFRKPDVTLGGIIPDYTQAPQKPAAPASPPPYQGPVRQQGAPLDKGTAQQFLVQAGGDKEKARELARQAGYVF